MGMHIPVVKFLADFLESCSFICMFGLPHLHCFKKKKICYYTILHKLQASLEAQTVKNLPAMQETWVSSLGWDNPLEEGMATHSCILAWRICMERGAWWATVHGVAESWTRLSD